MATGDGVTPCIVKATLHLWYEPTLRLGVSVLQWLSGFEVNYLNKPDYPWEAGNLITRGHKKEAENRLISRTCVYVCVFMCVYTVCVCVCVYCTCDLDLDIHTHIHTEIERGN